MLILGALGQHRFQRFVVGHIEETSDAKQTAEGLQRDFFFEPKMSIPGGEAGRVAFWRIDEHPVFAIGDEAEADVGAVQQFHHAGRRGRLPMLGGERLFEVLIEGISLHQQPRLGSSVGIADNEIGAQGFAMFGDDGLDRLGDVLPFGKHFIGEAKRLFQDELEPFDVDGGIGAATVLVVFPLVER